eukprot:symbB.v1.2.026724.t1/scaffold2695.1/size72873/4
MNESDPPSFVEERTFGSLRYAPSESPEHVSSEQKTSLNIKKKQPIVLFFHPPGKHHRTSQKARPSSEKFVEFVDGGRLKAHKLEFPGVCQRVLVVYKKRAGTSDNP